jgi:hypothetical protein
MSSVIRGGVGLTPTGVVDARRSALVGVVAGDPIHYTRYPNGHAAQIVEVDGWPVDGDVAHRLPVRRDPTAQHPAVPEPPGTANPRHVARAEQPDRSAGPTFRWPGEHHPTHTRVWWL